MIQRCIYPAPRPHCRIARAPLWWHNTSLRNKLTPTSTTVLSTATKQQPSRLKQTTILPLLLRWCQSLRLTIRVIGLVDFVEIHHNSRQEAVVRNSCRLLALATGRGDTCSLLFRDPRLACLNSFWNSGKLILPSPSVSASSSNVSIDPFSPVACRRKHSVRDKCPAANPR